MIRDAAEVMNRGSGENRACYRDVITQRGLEKR
jgi:hypothetical protein